MNSREDRVPPDDFSYMSGNTSKSVLVSYAQRIALAATEIESLNQESYTCHVKIMLNMGGGRSVSQT